MPPTLPEKSKKYYMTVTPILTAGCLCGMPTYLVLVLFRYGLHVNWRAFLIGAAGGCLAGWIAAVLVVRWFPTQVTEDGIHGYSALGLRRFLSWTDLARVRPFKLLGCQYLRLDRGPASVLSLSKEADTIWLAMFQRDQEEFIHVLQTLAPAGNPILEHLRTR
jgi:hypothetical protein